MVKLGKYLCDRCKTIISLDNGNFVSWETVRSRRKNTNMDFCNLKCRILFCKGKKYYQTKVAKMKANGISEEILYD